MRQVTENKELSTSFDPVAVLHVIATTFGVERLAAAMGKSVPLLYQKLTESSDYKTPSLREAVAITKITRDRGLLDAWCSAEGGVFVELPPASGGDEDVLEDLIALTESIGKFATDLRTARADGVISADEFTTQKRDALRVHQLLEHMLATLSSQVRSVPTNPRKA